MAHPQDSTVDTKTLRNFGASVGTVCLLIGALASYKGNLDMAAAWCALGAMLSGAALLQPHSLQRAHRLWMKLAIGLGYINTRVILGLLFYVVLAPVGIVLRMMGKDLLDQELEPKARSYWKTMPKAGEAVDHYSNPY